MRGRRMLRARSRMMRADSFAAGATVARGGLDG